MLQPIPANLITGFLGVGKTTAVINLLSRRPPGLRWAVLVNEYGDVAIDGALLGDAEDGELTIREIAGGCICCTSSLYFKVALAQILERVRPERILIETTGVGHPAKLLELLRLPVYADRIDLRATICLLDPSDLANPEMRARQVFRDQIEMADVLILNKEDTIDAATKTEFLNWARGLFPPKLKVATTRLGRLESAWLDLDCNPQRAPLFPEAHADEHQHEQHAEHISLPAAGQPLRRESASLGQRACGWIFSPADVFSEPALLQLLTGESGILRLKGVFHTEGGWISVNRVRNDADVKSTPYRLDSRVEVFAIDSTLDWQAFEGKLKSCLRS